MYIHMYIHIHIYIYIYILYIYIYIYGVRFRHSPSLAPKNDRLRRRRCRGVVSGRKLTAQSVFPCI